METCFSVYRYMCRHTASNIFGVSFFEGGATVKVIKYISGCSGAGLLHGSHDSII